jgi:hypothetical protein
VVAAGFWMVLFAADCSTAAQDCPAGQMCSAAGTPDSCPEHGQCEPLPAPTEIDLSLPVAKGERVFCVNDDFRHPRLRRSNACNPEERFGFSLASSAFEAPHVVVASADGVAYFWQGCGSWSLTSRAGASLGANSEARNFLQKCRAEALQAGFQGRWDAVWTQVRPKAK